MWTGYLYFGNVELANNERVISYLKGDPLNGVPGLRTPSTSFVADCGCETARPLFCDQGSGPDGAYVSPAADDAPWYDPNVPESAEFAGLFVEDIVGFDSTVRRTVNEGAINGGSLGPLRVGTRSITVTGWLRAGTCCGAEYGLRWLTEALIGNAACDDCKLGDLYMLKCCPPNEPCGLEINDTSATDDTNPVTMTIEDLGAIWRFRISDPNLTNVIAQTLVPGDDGALAVCISAPVIGDDNATWPFTYMGVDYELFLPFSSLGVGIVDPQTYELEIEKVPEAIGCPEYDDQVAATVDTIATLHGLVGDLVPFDVTNNGNINCYSFVPGFDQVTGDPLPFSNPDEFPRFMHRTGLVDGPKVLERKGTCCSSRCGCVNLRVQFTLTSELPYIFGDISWCLQDDFFPREEVYCNPLDWCDDCDNTVGTQIVYREVARPECPVSIRFDGTWCAEGWDPDTLGLPPTDCLLVANPESYDPSTAETPTTNTSNQGDPCLINLVNDGTWTAVNFDPLDGFEPEFCELQIGSPQGTCEEQQTIVCEAGEGTTDTCEVTLVGDGTWTPIDWDPSAGNFPPDCCTIDITNGGDCTCPDPPGGCVEADLVHCQVRLIYSVCTGETTWEPVNWDGDLVTNDCDCIDVCEFCIDPGEKCLVRVIYDEDTGEQLWEPIRWDGDITNECCTCFLIAEVEIRRANSGDECPPTSSEECPVLLNSDGTYTKIGWTWTEADGVFPPPECNITIANPQQTGPILEEVEIPADLFVPDCGPFPIVPPDPYAGFESCYCEPWGTFRACCTYDNPFQWNEATSVIQVKAGSREIRNMRIAAYRNPWADQGVACPCDPDDDFWKCREPCSTLLIPQLPSGSTITIDSRIRVAEVTFAGGNTTNGLRYIESEDGRPFDWFDVSQCAQLCIVVTADCTTIAEDAQVSIGFVSRYLASGW